MDEYDGGGAGNALFCDCVRLLRDLSRIVCVYHGRPQVQRIPQAIQLCVPLNFCGMCKVTGDSAEIEGCLSMRGR